jgi:hypothetical protein
MIVLPQWQFVEDEHHRWRCTRAGADDMPLDSATSFTGRVERPADAVRAVTQAQRSPCAALAVVRPLTDKKRPVSTIDLRQHFGRTFNIERAREEYQL